MLAVLDLPGLQVTPGLLVLKDSRALRVDQELPVWQALLELPDRKDLRDLKASMEYKVPLEQLDQLVQSVLQVPTALPALLEAVDKLEYRALLASLD